MRHVHDCLTFGFLESALESEIRRTRSTSPSAAAGPRILFGNPLADGEMPGELSIHLEGIALAVFFEGLDWELPARAVGRQRLVDALSERDIPTIWLATGDIPGSGDRTQSLNAFLQTVAATMCERAAAYERQLALRG